MFKALRLNNQTLETIFSEIDYKSKDDLQQLYEAAAYYDTELYVVIDPDLPSQPMGFLKSEFQEKFDFVDHELYNEFAEVKTKSNRSSN